MKREDNLFRESRGCLYAIASLFAINTICLAGSVDSVESKVEAIIRELSAGDSNGKAQLIKIVKQESISSPVLARFLDSPRSEVREAIFESLLFVPAACNELEPLIEKGLLDESKWVRSATVVLVGYKHCEDSGDALVQLLQKENNENTIVNGLYVLASFKSVNNSSVLAAIQNDSKRSLRIRISAAGALASIHHAFDESLLTQGLVSPKNEDIEAALLAYRYTSLMSHIPAIDRHLAKPGRLGPYAELAIASIEVNGTPTGKHTEKLNSLMNSDHRECRIWAVKKMIEENNSPVFVEELKRRIKDAHKAAAEIAHVLYEMKLMTETELRRMAENQHDH